MPKEGIRGIPQSDAVACDASVFFLNATKSGALNDRFDIVEGENAYTARPERGLSHV